MRTRTQVAVAATALLSAPVSAVACEPILPFIKVVGGPWLLTQSFLVLGIVVVLKSAAFARFQKKIGFCKALLWMLGANVLTSIIGVIAAAMIGSGGTLFLGIPIVWALCWVPAKRLVAAAPHPALAKCAPGVLAFGMTIGLVVSCILFSISSEAVDSRIYGLYWTAKIVAIYIALIISIGLTAFWEEWVVWRLSRSPQSDLSFVQPVIRANLIVLLGVMLISAAFMLPKRLKHPGFIAPEQSKAAVEHPKRAPLRI